ncbi:MAG: N-acetylmuramoyl-L-alanine amidase [Chloroflexi bacterium]|nr:N-acetylmuramoyl-L-alanine amidase [Chloroflexota bacterium]
MTYEAELTDIHSTLGTATELLIVAQGHVSELQAAMARGEPSPAPAVPWGRDISTELTTNPGPYDNALLRRDGGWWTRTLDQIDAVTIHHTMSHSPHATASHYIHKGGGRPSLPYSIWVTETGEVLLCVPLEQGLWHDHTGHKNIHLSLGLAGSLHINQPSQAQLAAAARVCHWAIETLPGVMGPESIKGHKDFTATACPGWTAVSVDRWRRRFFDLINQPGP